MIVYLYDPEGEPVEEYLAAVIALEPEDGVFARAL